MRIFSASPCRARSFGALVLCCWGTASALACGSVAGNDSPSGSGGAATGAAGAAGTSGAAGAGPRTPTPGCRAPAGVSNAPKSIAETMTLINALPKPLTLPCFLESLARPLATYATFSVISAQPAVGSRSPRIFLSIGANTMSIVPDGVGEPLLEFGEARPNYRSLKAEFEFPLLMPVLASTPYDRVMFNDQITSCALCHADEVQDSSISGVRAFVSQSFRPTPGERVSLAALQHELDICDRTREPSRCALLDGLLGWGPLVDFEFPTQMATF